MPEKDKKAKKDKKPKDDASDEEVVAKENGKDEKKDKKEKKSKNDEAEDMDFGDKKKKKKAKDGDDSDDEKKEKKKKKEKRKPTPLICSVLDIQPVPKKDKLRVCKVRFMEDMDPVRICTSAPNVCVGGKFLVALPGVTVATGIEIEETTIGGVESSGMFCGPKEMGWDTDILIADEAVMLDDEAEIGVVATYESAVEAFREREKAEAAKAEAAAAAKAKGKKGKKGKADKEEDDDLDALLEEAGMKVEPDSKAESKKKGKKGKPAKKDDDEDDAVFDEFKEEPKAEEPKAEEPKAEEPAKKEEEEAAAPAAPEGDAGDEEVDAKTLANRKKKEKKAKAKAAGGAGFFKDDDADGAEAAESGAAASKGAAPKKLSAAVRAAQEKLEMQKKLDAERDAHYEAEKKRIEEEERIEREEQERIEEERRKKREAREAKIAKQKADGTYQTKTEKLRKARAAQLREQFGFNLEDVGNDEEGEAKPKSRAVATKKKKQPKRQEEEEAPVEEQAQEEVKPAAPKAEEKKKEEVEEEADDGDDWEAQAEKLEEEAAEKKEKKAEAKADEEGGSDEEDDSDSDSNSSSDSSSSDDFGGYRSPIVCIMGHVDTGKTKLLDKIRRTNVQEGEAGGITQQIGATFFPDIALEEQTKKVNEDFELELPGLLIIDTPGHESFNNLRKRGSSLCDIAILVIDIMHGLEPQTVESLEMLKIRRCPFIIALNKIDRCLSWKSDDYTAIQDALGRQVDSGTIQDFETRLSHVQLQLAERGLNTELYWKNEALGSTVSIVPTSAMTGEGVPDLLYLLLSLSQNLFPAQLEVDDELNCTVIEVKAIEGHGTTIDVVLVNGTLNEGDKIVIAGMGGPIVTTIRALLTPAPMKEMRVKGEYIHHNKICVSMGVKISAPGLENAVAGTELKVVSADATAEDLEDLKDEVQDGFESILSEIDKSAAGVYVKASTLGSLEALLAFLQDMKIPVFDVGIGEVHKKDVKRTLIMKEKGHPEYAVILAFDVKVNSDAFTQANTDGVQIMTADIIYHLQEKFETYMKGIQDAKKTETRMEAVFPVILEIDKQYIFHKKDPIVVGCKVVGGQLKVGTPICVPEKDFLEIGRVGGIEKDKKEVKIARRGENVCVKIDQNTSQNHIAIPRHFDHTNRLYSKISRESIDVLKEHFKDEMKKEDWEVVIGMKAVFKIT